jgi:hypothetical protein
VPVSDNFKNIQLVKECNVLYCAKDTKLRRRVTGLATDNFKNDPDTVTSWHLAR